MHFTTEFLNMKHAVENKTYGACGKSLRALILLNWMFHIILQLNQVKNHSLKQNRPLQQETGVVTLLISRNYRGQLKQVSFLTRFSSSSSPSSSPSASSSSSSSSSSSANYSSSSFPFYFSSRELRCVVVY